MDHVQREHGLHGPHCQRGCELEAGREACDRQFWQVQPPSLHLCHPEHIMPEHTGMMGWTGFIAAKVQDDVRMFVPNVRVSGNSGAAVAL